MMVELVNILLTVMVLLVVKIRYKIDNLVTLAFLGHIAIIFLLNDVLFPSTYFPDQKGFFELLQTVRNYLYTGSLEETFSLFISAAQLEDTQKFTFTTIYTLIPLPTINSYYTIGLMNFIIFLLVFLYLKKEDILNNQYGTWFYLLYPSLALYQSLALKDFLTSILFLLAIHFIVTKKYILNLIILWLVFLIKKLNFIILISSFILSSLIDKLNMLRIGIAITTVVVMYYLLIDYFSFEFLDERRTGFYFEAYKSLENYVPIDGLFTFLTESINGIINVLFSPMCLACENLFQSIQVLENIMIFMVLCFILFKNVKLGLFKDNRVVFLNIMLLMAFVVIGLFAFNAGAISRYKMPFILGYIIYSIYFIHSYKNKEIIDESKVG